ncbi:MAG: lantibiotic dehydratase family protein [Muribaculum sp.]|nr:lantibiotic dehydratase family protein [Muribaculum sp.]
MKRTFTPTEIFVVRRPCLDYKGNPVEGSHVETLMRQEFFQEAIYYASPDLYSELMKYINGKLPEKKKQRMIATLYKYVERMNYRCTPFGMFAKCSVGHYSRNTEIPKKEKLNMHYRYDCQFLHDYTVFLIKTMDSGFLSTLSLCANQTCLTVSEHIRMHARNETGTITEIRVKRSDLLEFILSSTRYGVECKELVSLCIEEYDISETELLEYIRKLILKGILISDLQVETVGEDNFARIVKKWSNSKLPLLHELVHTMDVLQGSLDFSEKKLALESLYDKSQQLGFNVKRNQMIQVDTYGMAEIEIDDRVRASIVEWFELLLSVCTPTGNPLSNFSSRFAARYEGMSVPLLEVLDKQIGIGYTPGFPSHSNLIDSIYSITGNRPVNSPIKTYSLTILEQMILDRLIDSVSLTTKRINLTDKEFRNHEKISHSDFCISLSCMFSIVGYNDDGPILNSIHFSGPSASCLLTRFADGHSGIKSIVSEIAKVEQSSNKNIVMAEISHLSRPHSGNVQIRPNIREYKIPYLSHSIDSRYQEINISDLTVSVVDGKVKLNSTRIGKEICPCFSSAYNYKFGTSDLYQFLGDVQRQNATKILSSRMDSLLSMLGHLPRVTFKNIIITAETWIIDNTWTKLDFVKGLESFLAMMKKLDMPRFLSFNQGDNYFIVDNESDISIREFFNLTKNMRKVTLYEFLPLAEDIKHYDTVIEIVQPFLQKEI